MQKSIALIVCLCLLLMETIMPAPLQAAGLSESYLPRPLMLQHPAPIKMDQRVNAVIGDISFIKAFGHFPTPETDSQTRIYTHLTYVESALRRHIPAEIEPQYYPMRAKLLNHLRQYRKTGVFPHQRAYAGRRPHFKDEQGRLCAVGHLIAQTEGLELVNQINAKYRYAYLTEMKMPKLQQWVQKSGLTLRELAMIQPSYAGRTIDIQPNPITPISTPTHMPQVGSEIEGVQEMEFNEADAYAIVSTLIMFASFIPQFSFFLMSPVQYLAFQETHISITVALYIVYLSSLAVLSILDLRMIGYLLIGLVQILLTGPLHTYILSQLDIYMRKQIEFPQAPLPWGVKQVALLDGTQTWSVQTSLSF